MLHRASVLLMNRLQVSSIKPLLEGMLIRNVMVRNEIRSTLGISNSKFILNNGYLKVTLLVPEYFDVPVV